MEDKVRDLQIVVALSDASVHVALLRCKPDAGADVAVCGALRHYTTRCHCS